MGRIQGVGTVLCAGGMEVGVVVCSRVETIEWASKERVYGIGMCHGIGMLDLGIMG
jgi:hypothetical protein